MTTTSTLRIRAYAVALAMTAIAFVIRLILDPVLGEQPAYSIFLLPVMMSAAYGGTGPAVLSAILAIVSLYGYIRAPVSLESWSRRDQIETLLFVVAAFGVVLLSRVVTRARERAQQALIERERLIDELEGREAQLSSVLSTVPDAMIVIDERGLIQSFSATAELLFGYRADEVRSHNVSMLMPQPYSDEHDGYLHRYLTTGQRRIIGIGRIVVGQRKDGTTFPMELAVGEVVQKDRRLFTGFIRDLTERQESERRLQEAQAELVHISRLSELGQMAAALAHEVNQPLAAVSIYLKAARRLLDGGDATKVPSAVERAEGEAHRAAAIVNRLREFSKKHEMERLSENLPKVIEEACALALVGAKSSGIRVHMDLDPHSMTAYIDKIQIQQVLFNLVRNAVEAMADSPTRDLMITTMRAGDMVEVAVSDSGPGLPEVVRKHLFQPFVTTKREGMGVGLSICRSIIEAHGGRLWADTPSEGGTAFRFTLPTRAEDPPAASA